MKSSNKLGWNIRAAAKVLVILVLAVVIAGPVFTPVVADERDYRDRGHQENWDRGRPPGHGDRDRRGHPDRDRQWRPEGHGRYYWQGRYYDSPPPGYYAPPPPVVEAPPPPPPGITFVFPLHF